MKSMLKHIVLIIVFVIINQIAKAQFIVLPGNSITIKEGGNLYVGTNMTLKSDANGSGHFVDQTTNGDVNITGNIVVERFIPTNEWHNISSPVSISNTSIFGSNDLTFYYDETEVFNDWNFGWVWFQGDLLLMKGYDVFLNQSSAKIDYTASNSSSLNTGFYNIAVSRTNSENGETENHKGWNLIGNPYPSPVDWLEESGWNKTNINDAKYIWNPATDNYTIFLGGSNPIGINGGTQFIPSNQGFWVQAISNGNISVNNNSRKGTMETTPDFYKNGTQNYPCISVVAKGNSLSDETLIRFIENTTIKFDRNFDAVKLLSGSKIIPQISTNSNNCDFAINTLPSVIDGNEIPLNFSCNTNGNYKLELEDKSFLGEIESIYLFDRITKCLIDFTFLKEYNFQHNSLNNKQRFVLVINPTNNKLISLKAENPYLVYSNNNNIHIKTLSGETENLDIEIINILGQTILKRTHYGNLAIINTNTIKGYCIVKIISKKGQFNKKILIH
jgi:hypothetical protein